MNSEKKIQLSFELEQVANDILVKCNQISQSIRDEAMEDIKANILEPDNPESRSIINRALTEAFGEVKTMCQRYLKSGRTIDDNKLERMVKSVTYVKVQDTDAQGHLLYNADVSGVITVVYTEDEGTTWKKEEDGTTVQVTGTPEPKMVDDPTQIDTITYEVVPLELHIPNFNVAVTDDLKSGIHRFVVDYILGEFLQDQLADKAAEYKALAEEKDRTKIVKDLNARDRFNYRKPSWV